MSPSPASHLILEVPTQPFAFVPPPSVDSLLSSAFFPWLLFIFLSAATRAPPSPKRPKWLIFRTLFLRLFCSLCLRCFIVFTLDGLHLFSLDLSLHGNIVFLRLQSLSYPKPFDPQPFSDPNDQPVPCDVNWGSFFSPGKYYKLSSSSHPTDSHV